MLSSVLGDYVSEALVGAYYNREFEDRLTRTRLTIDQCLSDTICVLTSSSHYQ